MTSRKQTKLPDLWGKLSTAREISNINIPPIPVTPTNIYTNTIHPDISNNPPYVITPTCNPNYNNDTPPNKHYINNTTDNPHPNPTPSPPPSSSPPNTITNLNEHHPNLPPTTHTNSTTSTSTTTPAVLTTFLPLPPPLIRKQLKLIQEPSTNLCELSLKKLISTLKSDPIGSSYPLPHRRKAFPPHPSLSIKQSLIPNAGRGVFTTRRIKKDTILGIYSGKVTNVITPYSLEMESKIIPLGHLTGGFLVDGTPTGNLDHTTLAIINEHIWTDLDGNRKCPPNVKIEEMGVMRVIRNINPGKELLTDYSNSYNWDHLKLDILPNLFNQIHIAQLLLCADTFADEVESLRTLTHSWTPRNLETCRSQHNTISTLTSLLETDLTTTSTHCSPPYLTWSRGTHCSLAQWLTALSSYDGFINATHFRRHNEPGQPMIDLAETIVMDLQLSTPPPSHWTKNTLLYICSDIHPHSKLGIQLGTSRPDTNKYVQLMELAAAYPNPIDLAEHLRSSPLQIYSWERPFNNNFTDETDGDGYCGYLAIHQACCRTSRRIPTCLHMKYKHDRAIMTTFLEQLCTQANPVAAAHIGKVITHLNATNGSPLPEALWVNTDCQLGITLHPKLAWWNTINGKCVVSSHHSHLHSWPSIYEMASGNRHIGLSHKHHYLTHWTPLEASHLLDCLMDICHQLLTHLNIHYLPSKLNQQPCHIAGLDLYPLINHSPLPDPPFLALPPPPPPPPSTSPCSTPAPSPLTLTNADTPPSPHPPPPTLTTTPAFPVAPLLLSDKIAA